MKALPKIIQTKAKIRFQDCDPFNHLNNSSYINYFINHREDALIENYDLDIYKMAKEQGKSWVTSSNQIAYLKPAFLIETVVIESQLIHFTNSKLHVEMRMYNADKSHLKSIMWSSFVHFNLIAQKREIHAAKFMDLFEYINKPIAYKSFEDRVQHFKHSPLKKEIT